MSIDIAPPNFGVEERAHAGDWDAVADYIERGGHITAELRPLLAARLRGLKRGRGRPGRTEKQERTELKIVGAVRSLQRDEVLLHGRRSSLSAAKKRYLDFRMSKGEPLSEKTLEAYLARHGGGLSQKELQAMEEIRSELIEEGALRQPNRSRQART